MNQKIECLTTIKEYEREKAYRLSRRLEALQNLLKTIDDSLLTFENPDELKLKIKNDISICEEKQNKWWEVIRKRYSLPIDKSLKVQIYTGEIYVC